MMNKEIQMTQADGPEKVVFVAGATRTYMMDYDIKTDKGEIHISITDENGEVYFDIIAGEIFGGAHLDLEEGEYTISFQIVPQDAIRFYNEKGYDTDGYYENEEREWPAHEDAPVHVEIKISII